MRKTLQTLDWIFKDKVRADTARQLSAVARAQTHASRERSQRLLDRLAHTPGPQVDLGGTTWGGRVLLPVEFLAEAHSVITGGTGSGKTMAALTLIQAILDAPDANVSFGVLDAKGELFERTLFLIAQRLSAPGAAADRLAERVVIIDLSSPDPLSPYNIACPWAGSDFDFFASSRVGTFLELLPSGDGLSLRGSSIVKHALMLLAEQRLPFSYVDRVLSSEPFRAGLLARSNEGDVREYFKFHFPNEGRAAIGAVRARIASSLMSSLSLKLALSGSDAPDLRAHQDDGKIVLINCAGPNISRTTARTLQALFLSDIRQAVFSRRRKQPYLWVCDEAQNFFRTRQLRENMAELLTMSRSFGSFFLYLTQNLSTAVQDPEMLETLHTNIRWSLSLRGTSKDGAFLKEAFPLTGRMPKPRTGPYAPQEFYAPAEERAQLLAGLTHLPDFVGWLWLKALTGEAIRIETQPPNLPRGDAFTEVVNRIRSDPGIGCRHTRAAFLAEISRRDAQFAPPDEAGLADTLKKSYHAEEEVAR